jgi:DNA-binding response OmpR family regulator
MYRVLIADPDTALADHYREALEGEEFWVETAANGLECIALLRTFRFDVLVLEPELPWGWGDGVLALMGEDDSLARVAVVAVGLCPEACRLRAWEDRIATYQRKPLPAARLADIVRDLVPPKEPLVPLPPGKG